VLDPFMGSGSVLASALLCGRSGTGIELDNGIVNVAQQRLVGFAQSGSRMMDDLA
jgi:DNA modification methylase